MIDNVTINTLSTDPKALVGGAILALIVVVLIVRKLRKSTTGKIADKLVGPVMFLGMVWSADAVWVLTGPDHMRLPSPLRIAMFAVLEFALLVAMLRAKDSMDRIGHTGMHGATAWLIASVIAGFGFILGLYEGGLVVAAFRPLVPLMLTKLWWDGVLGDSPRKAGSFKWTLRNLLILLGAIEASDRDVQTVNRERLIDQMVALHRKWSSAEGDRQTRLEGKLVELSEKADAEIIAEVRRRRDLSNWFTVTQVKKQPMPDEVTHLVTQADAPRDAHRDADVAVTPARRSKAVTQGPTSNDARDADPATQAAHLVLTQGLSTRKAADAVGGTSPATVGRRVKELRPMQPDAVGDAGLTQNPINGHPVLESAN